MADLKETLEKYLEGIEREYEDKRSHNDIVKEIQDFHNNNKEGSELAINSVKQFFAEDPILTVGRTIEGLSASLDNLMDMADEGITSHKTALESVNNSITAMHFALIKLMYERQCTHHV